MSTAASHIEGFFGDSPIDDVRYTVRIEGAPDPDWWVRRVRYAEAISEPYELDMDIVAQQKDVLVDPDVYLGLDVVLDMERDGVVRSVQGIIHRVSAVDDADQLSAIQVQVVPAWIYLTEHVDTRIFQDLSAPEIIQEVLEPALEGYGRKIDLALLNDDYVVRDYCVQYAESAFDFASRLMEEEGIAYHFRAEQDGKPTSGELMVLTDQEDGAPNADFDDVEGIFDEEVHIIADRPGTADVESIQALQWTRPEQVSKVVMRRFNWKRPVPDQSPEAEIEQAHPRGYDREIYIPDERRRVVDKKDDPDYQGTEVEQDEQATARRRFEMITWKGRGRGTSNLVGMRAGGIFTLADHMNAAISGQRLLVTRVSHTGHVPVPGHGDIGGPQYQNAFECILADDPYRPLIKTRRPRIHGPQTAMVVGPADEEIHTDAHGRIKVRYHWDRLNPPDDTASCWVRVAQTWAGPKWGSWFVPRVGMEVLVEFLDGNPDRPLVTGCVYNGANATPYLLPDDKTKSTIKTNSSPGGEGYNEIRFEDASGSEEIFVHAQKDFNKIVLNDRTKDIGHDHTEAIGNDHTQTIGNDKSISVGANHTESISKNMSLSVGESRSASIGADDSESIGGALSQSVDKSKSVVVGGDSVESVDKSKSVMVKGAFDTSCDDALTSSVKLSTTLSSGKDFNIGTDKIFNVDAKEDINEKAGKKMNLMAGDDLTIKTDKKGNITAADELTLKVGSAKIVMKSNGDILVNGAKINVKGSGAVVVKGSSIDNN